MNSVGISGSGKRFVPLLFAGDINVYSVARAFHEAYGCVSKVYGKYRSGPCMHSRIVDYTAVETADRPEEFLRLVRGFALEHRDESVVLVGCGDSYVQLAARFKGEYPENVVAPYIDEGLMNTLINKEAFYGFCAENGVDFPDTFVHRKEMGEDFSLPFGGPFIVKPSNGIEYWRHPYPSQKKVYRVNTRSELNAVLSDIYGSGYSDSVIIQDMIPGDDSCMRVLTSYSDRNGRVTAMCLGHVLLEEHTPHGIGNHAVILTECDRALMDRYRALLEGIRFTGWSNFDIKYDGRDGKFKAFEINTRQGRSNFYVTASGCNVARQIIEDRLDGAEKQTLYVDAENLWLVVPRRVALDYCNRRYSQELRRLFGEGKVSNPLYYAADAGLRKRFAVAKNLMGHFVKFRKYLGR